MTHTEGYVGWSGFSGATMPPLSEFRVYETPAEVWAVLYNDMETFGWSHVPDNEDDPEGPQSLSPAAVKVQEMEAANRTGTVRSPSGAVWEVVHTDDL